MAKKKSDKLENDKTSKHIDRVKLKHNIHKKHFTHAHFAQPKHLDSKTKKIYATYGNGKPNMRPHAATSTIYKFYPSNKFTGTVICIFIVICFAFFCYLSGKTQPRTNPTTDTTRVTSQYARESHMANPHYANHHLKEIFHKLNLPEKETRKLLGIYHAQSKSNKQVILHQIYIYNKTIPNKSIRRLTIINYLSNIKKQLKVNNQNDEGHSNNGNEL